MISESLKSLFVHIPKTGGNSVLTALKDYSTDKLEFIRQGNGINVLNQNKINKHGHLSEYQKHYNLSEYFKFTIVRNPYDRMLSWYFYEHKEFNEQTFYDFLIKNFTKHEYLFQPQIYFLLNYNFDIDINLMLRYENLETDFKRLCEKLKIDVSLPWVNKSKNSEIDYKDYYTDRTKKIIEIYYYYDLVALKYKF